MEQIRAAKSAKARQKLCDAHMAAMHEAMQRMHEGQNGQMAMDMQEMGMKGMDMSLCLAGC